MLNRFSSKPIILKNESKVRRYKHILVVPVRILVQILPAVCSTNLMVCDRLTFNIVISDVSLKMSSVSWEGIKQGADGGGVEGHPRRLYP